MSLKIIKRVLCVGLFHPDSATSVGVDPRNNVNFTHVRDGDTTPATVFVFMCVDMCVFVHVGKYNLRGATSPGSIGPRGAITMRA